MEDCPILFFGIDPERITSVQKRFPEQQVLQCGNLGFQDCLDRYALVAENVSRVVIDRRPDWNTIAWAARRSAGNVQSVVVPPDCQARVAAMECAVNDLKNVVKDGLMDI